MNNETLYSKKTVCEMLEITTFTIENWYRWEQKELQNGEITERYLPIPIKLQNVKGRPLQWTMDMIEILMKYKESIVHGRNGKYGKYTNAAWHSI